MRSIFILFVLFFRYTVVSFMPFARRRLCFRARHHRAEKILQARTVDIISSSISNDTELSASQVNNDASNREQEKTIDHEQWDLRFGSVGRLYGTSRNNKKNKSKGESAQDEASIVVDRLRESTVVVVGLGGVGSWAAEALCRSGVGNLILIDLDDICISNTNRQLHATSSAVGKMKIDQMRHRLVDINPDVNVTLIHDFISTQNVKDILNQCFNVVAARTVPATESSNNNNNNNNINSTLLVLDAIDGGEEKSALIAACTDYEIPIVTCGGAAGKRDPTLIVCEDLVRVKGDKFLASCRSTLRKLYNFPQGLSFSELRKRRRPMRTWRISAIYSPEEPPKIIKSREPTSSLRRCDGELGTACFVTGSFGFLAAARCVDMITGAIPFQAPKRR